MSSPATTTTTCPTVLLSDGNRMPVIGLGTYLAKKGECEAAVAAAIRAGYRHIDTAFVYQNEAEVGRAVRAAIADGLVQRSDMFVVTKLGNHHHAAGQVRPACERSVELLGLGPIDLYLMHTPMGRQPDDTDYVDTWLEMEQLVGAGLVRSLGVSNFNSEQLGRLLERATIRPVTNQVECSPNLAQRRLREFHARHGIVLTAYAPLTRPHRTAAGQPVTALADPVVQRLAAKWGRTEAQICLRYMLTLGTVPIPKSSNAGRIAENIAVFDFELDAEDVAAMEQLDCGLRMCPFEPDRGHKYFPFDIEY